VQAYICNVILKQKIMKKSILVLAMIVFSTSIVSAQEFVKFGAKGGVNFTNMTSDGFDDNSSRTGFHLGLLAEVPVSERFYTGNRG
jgi:hypothetical protein